ncbi:MAG: hypothetical protein C0501_14655 [Isosphaera sp.]|nr:hypothetical protein [Isosphaera sp.]
MPRGRGLGLQPHVRRRGRARGRGPAGVQEAGPPVLRPRPPRPAGRRHVPGPLRPLPAAVLPPRERRRAVQVPGRGPRHRRHVQPAVPAEVAGARHEELPAAVRAGAARAGAPRVRPEGRERRLLLRRGARHRRPHRPAEGEAQEGLPEVLPGRDRRRPDRRGLRRRRRRDDGRDRRRVHPVHAGDAGAPVPEPGLREPRDAAAGAGCPGPRQGRPVLRPHRRRGQRAARLAGVRAVRRRGRHEPGHVGFRGAYGGPAVWQEIVAEAVTLFVIIDPIGGSTLFLALTTDHTPAERRRVALKSVAVAAGILVAFLFAGGMLLHAMGISVTAFQIAGGVILLLFGLSMIFEFGPAAKPPGGPESGDVAVYPLAMPAMAGPGTIMTVVLLSDDDRYRLVGQLTTVLVLLAVLALTYVLFRLAIVFQRFLGATGASIVKRVMGLLLCAVAVDKLLAGVADFCRGLPG